MHFIVTCIKIVNNTYCCKLICIIRTKHVETFYYQLMHIMLKNTELLKNSKILITLCFLTLCATVGNKSFQHCLMHGVTMKNETCLTGSPMKPTDDDVCTSALFHAVKAKRPVYRSLLSATLY